MSIPVEESMYCIEHDTAMTPDHDYFMHSDFSDDEWEPFDDGGDAYEPRAIPGRPTYRYGGPNED